MRKWIIKSTVFEEIDLILFSFLNIFLRWNWFVAPSACLRQYKMKLLQNTSASLPYCTENWYGTLAPDQHVPWANRFWSIPTRPSADPPPPSRWRSRQSYACGRRRPPPMTLRRWTRRVVANFWQNFARFRLYRRRSLQENTRFSAFFKIYQIIQLKFLKFGNILQILQHLQNFAEFYNFYKNFNCWFFKPIFAKMLSLERCKSVHIL